MAGERTVISIRPFIGQQSTFEPQALGNALETMSKVFDDVCVLMQITPNQLDQSERLAVQIIDLSQSGIAKADVLREMLIAGRLRFANEHVGTIERN